MAGLGVCRIDDAYFAYSAEEKRLAAKNAAR